jgi:hypothetical protein
MKKIKHVSRRQFLKGAGGAYLAIPFLPSLLPRSAWGQTVPSPKRLIAMWTGNGTVTKNWYPSVDPITVIGTNVRASNLSSIAGPISTILGPELSAFRSKLLLLRGLDGMGGDGHNTEEILAASRALETEYSSRHVSIDRILGDSAKVYSKEPKIRVLSLAAQDRQQNISFMKSGDAIVRAPFIHDMRVAFETLFSGVSSNPAEAESIKARGLTLVDRVFKDYQKVMGSRQISSSDKLRLESHINHISELQKRIQDSSVSAGCVPPASGSPWPGDRGLHDPYLMPIADPYLNNMFDIVAAALRCDLTRIVTLVPWHYSCKFRFLAEQGYPSDLHALAHGQNALTDVPLTMVQQYFARQFAVLLKKLEDSIEDISDGSTLLDHTAVLWRQEFSANGDFNHKKIDLPVILAGGTKFLNSGRYVDYRTLGVKRRNYDATWIGVPYNQTLVTLLSAFGLTPTDYEAAGEAGYGWYKNPDVTENQYALTDAKRRAPLFSLLKS